MYGNNIYKRLKSHLCGAPRRRPGPPSRPPGISIWRQPQVTVGPTCSCMRAGTTHPGTNAFPPGGELVRSQKVPRLSTRLSTTAIRSSIHPGTSGRQQTQKEEANSPPPGPAAERPGKGPAATFWGQKKKIRLIGCSERCDLLSMCSSWHAGRPGAPLPSSEKCDRRLFYSPVSMAYF